MKICFRHHRVLFFIILFLFTSFEASSQKNKWRIEAESPESSVEWHGDTAEIIAPKGLTLWYKEKMEGDVVIEYDACVINKSEKDRTSDLNCFWMATDPSAKNIWSRMKWRGGKFANSYSLKLYYMGYGGNYNTTTRFRRYTGDERGIDDTMFRPGILKEYTDSSNLIRPNHWYKIRLESIGGRVRYFIDGKCLVNYCDPEPLSSGWFGFRTTLSHTKICNFKYSTSNPDERPITLKWIGNSPTGNGRNEKQNSVSASAVPVTFGVPLRKGTAKEDTPLRLCQDNGKPIDFDKRILAYWPDGSVKWLALSAVVPSSTDSCSLEINPKTNNKNAKSTKGMALKKPDGRIEINTGKTSIYLGGDKNNLIDSIVTENVTTAKELTLEATYDRTIRINSRTTTERLSTTGIIKNIEIEQEGNVRCVVLAKGTHVNNEGEILPFSIRIYCYSGSDEIKLVHTFVVDSVMSEGRISSIGLKMKVPMRETHYNRLVAFADSEGGVWAESIQPLVGRRPVTLPKGYAANTIPAYTNIQSLQLSGTLLPEYEAFDSRSRMMIDNLAKWDEYRLSQLSSNSFSIRKRATSLSPWIGTKEGKRASGTAFIGDCSGGIIAAIKDFWQSYPSTIEISGARGDNATLGLWIWSPEAEAMNLTHYDTIAHSLEASYEDVQEGLSSAYGIARTSTIIIKSANKFPGKEIFSETSKELTGIRQLVCTPEYLHQQRVFGIWSLPDRSTKTGNLIENRLNYIIDFYKNAIEQHSWYGFWNYGDFMHTYDAARHEWMYDVGGFAWDNTELASNSMLWYNFLRTGRADIWLMAEAMTRHTSEVDVYHDGPNAMLGSRHNVSHWGCGAKEARISQATWNRFYYYLTGDERSGDLMTEVRNAEQKLYTLDPMRLAQPRSLYPCTAPARLRIGPDWLAYCANWLTEWERTGNIAYRDKIIAGMKSISKMPHGIFSGPKALGFYPDTGEITNECDSTIQNTNHLLPIMGGFEIMNEIMQMIHLSEWNETWLHHAANYKYKATTISRNNFKIPRLAAYAAWITGKEEYAQSALNDLLRIGRNGEPTIFNNKSTKIDTPEVLTPVDEDMRMNTNDAATWSLDAIFMQEVLK